MPQTLPHFPRIVTRGDLSRPVMVSEPARDVRKHDVSEDEKQNASVKQFHGYLLSVLIVDAPSRGGKRA